MAEFQRCVRTFALALLLIMKKEKQPKSPSKGQHRDRLWQWSSRGCGWPLIILRIKLQIESQTGFLIKLICLKTHSGRFSFPISAPVTTPFSCLTKHGWALPCPQPYCSSLPQGKEAFRAPDRWDNLKYWCT